MYNTTHQQPLPPAQVRREYEGGHKHRESTGTKEKKINNHENGLQLSDCTINLRAV
jgi:hypothetical protein